MKITEHFQFRFPNTTNKGKIIPCIYRTGHKYILNPQESDARGGTNGN